VIPEFTATACAGVFAGAAVYINLAQYPAALELGISAAVQFFRPMYARAAPMQVSLALLGSGAGLWAWWNGNGWPWLLGSLLLGFVIPFTLVAIAPATNRLKDPHLDASSAEAADLLARWSRLHAVRSIVSTMAFLVFVAALVRSY
jgi:hypothetical protein